MKNGNSNSSISIPVWGVCLILFVILYLMYAPSFTSDYLMNDEVNHIGSQTNPFQLFIVSFFRFGRSLFGLYTSIVYNFTDYDPIKIQFIRFINWISLTLIGLILFNFLRLESKSIYLSFFTILFLFSQLSFQAHIGYSVQTISNSQPSMWLSLLAFYLHFYLFQKDQYQKWLSYIIVFIIFLLAMQSTQTYAYFCMVPLSFLVLTKDKNYNQQILTFFILALASFIVSVILYKASLEISNIPPYKLGKEGLESLTASPLKVLLTAINPKTYWSAFQFWTYPYPFHYTLPLGHSKRILAAIVMIGWFSLILTTIVTEIFKSQGNEKKQIILKWLWALICLVFGAIFIIADSPIEKPNLSLISERRPHITMVFSSVCIFIGAYAFQALSLYYKIFNITIIKSISILVIILNSFGAQSSLLKGIVKTRENQINFIRTELSNKSANKYQKITVVLPKSNVCISEPCNAWFGYTNHWRNHLTYEGRYRYVLRTLGISDKSKQIIFVDNYPKKIAEDEIIINWEKYSKAHKRHFRYLYNLKRKN